MVGALIGHSLVGVADLGGLPTPNPASGAGVLVEHHRGDVIQGVLMGPGSGIDDRRRTGDGDNGDRALVSLEPHIHMVGLPGTDLFVLGDAHPELGRQADEVGVSRPGVAVADIDQAQPQRPADGRVRAVDDTRAHGRSPKV